MPRRAMRFEERSTSSCPAKAMLPRRWPMMPMIARKVVVLPAPLRPSSVTSSPSPTVKSMPCRICDSPYQASSPATRSISLAAAASAMPGPHIGLDHLGIFRDLGVASLRQDLAAREHGDRVREVGHDREVVLDHEDGPVRG